jgi:hypothetical protein
LLHGRRPFRGTVGGTSGPDGDLGKLKHSILDACSGSIRDAGVPGHREQTTIADERRSNPFIRAWLDGEGLGSEPCRVSGEDASLGPTTTTAVTRRSCARLRQETIVGGSRVERVSPPRRRRRAESRTIGTIRSTSSGRVRQLTIAGERDLPAVNGRAK